MKSRTCLRRGCGKKFKCKKKPSFCPHCRLMGYRSPKRFKQSLSKEDQHLLSLSGI